jgi:hypothetical protein
MLAGMLVNSSGRLVKVPGGRGVREEAKGRLVSTEKTLIFWGWPLSRTEKLFCLRPTIGSPCLSLTMTFTSTSRVLTRNEDTLLAASADGRPVALTPERKESRSPIGRTRLEGQGCVDELTLPGF